MRPGSSSAPALRRTLGIGGVDKAGLLARLRAAGVRLNPLAEQLFAEAGFCTAPLPSRVEIAELTPAELGLAEGGRWAELLAQAAAQGLGECPLELAPHLRLALLDQPEGSMGQVATQHRAPPGSITVVSAALSADEELPKGFYLRCIDGVQWLRGYRSWPGHHWSADDRLVFLCTAHTAEPGDAARRR
ncbi:hypothetical protein [Paucibacter soli]|uniref:hypothetical protein n=1 Tax=Paucibacter soli TaxID=3133433 RepID=UPI0030AE5E37